MLFPTTDFAVFFGLVFLISWLLNPFPVRWRVFMVAASYVFYAWWDWHFVFLLGGSTLLNYFGALGAYRARAPSARRASMIAAVAGGLGLLAWFKYTASSRSTSPTGCAISAWVHHSRCSR